MSVGKASIKRAANAGTKKAAEVKETTTEVKAPEAVKADNVKAPAKTAAKKTTSRSSATKTTAAKKTTARKTTAKSAASVKTSVLTPSNSEEIQAAFISDKAKQPENTNVPVHVTEDLPIYLL